MPKSLGKRKRDLIVVGPFHPVSLLIRSFSDIRMSEVFSEILVTGEVDGGIKVSGGLDSLPKALEDWNVYLVVTLMLNKEKRLRKRFWKEIITMENIINEKLISLVHHNNFISKSCEIEKGCLVFPYNTILDAKLDEGSIIYPNCFINNGVQIGKYSVIESGVIIDHDVSIGSGCYIGAGSVVASEVKISSFLDIVPNTYISKDIRSEREI